MPTVEPHTAQFRIRPSASYTLGQIWVSDEHAPECYRVGIARLNQRFGCAYRKSHPAILMVQSGQDRAADNASGCFGGARYRPVFVQRQMGARHVREQHVTQMAFSEHHDMINAFPAD